jgi:hypothetical protein
LTLNLTPGNVSLRAARTSFAVSAQERYVVITISFLKDPLGHGLIVSPLYTGCQQLRIKNNKAFTFKFFAKLFGSRLANFNRNSAIKTRFGLSVVRNKRHSGGVEIEGKDFEISRHLELLKRPRANR